jgi:cell division initiation protein
MTLTPLAVRKTRFTRRWRGYDPTEVEDFLQLMADELTAVLKESERLLREKEGLLERLEASEQREQKLQETLLRAQKVSEELISTAQHEAQTLVREAQMTSEKIVQQALQQAQKVESKIGELRHRRRELQIKLRGTLELFTQILEAEMQEAEHTATVHTITPGRSSTEAG